MSLLPNGDWRDWERIHIHVPAEAEANLDMEQLTSDVTQGLINALQYRRLRGFTRSRWLGQEEAACDVGSFYCHGTSDSKAKKVHPAILKSSLNTAPLTTCACSRA